MWSSPPRALLGVGGDWCEGEGDGMGFATSMLFPHSSGDDSRSPFMTGDFDTDSGLKSVLLGERGVKDWTDD